MRKCMNCTGRGTSAFLSNGGRQGIALQKTHIIMNAPWVEKGTNIHHPHSSSTLLRVGYKDIDRQS